jgi:hypothetical protein
MDCHVTLPWGSCNGGDDITPGRAACELLLIAKPGARPSEPDRSGFVMASSAIIWARSTAENAMTVPIAPMPTNASPTATTSLMANCLRRRMMVIIPVFLLWQWRFPGQRAGGSRPPRKLALRKRSKGACASRRSERSGTQGRFPMPQQRLRTYARGVRPSIGRWRGRPWVWKASGGGSSPL